MTIKVTGFGKWLQGFPNSSAIKNPLAVQETQENREDPLEKGMATHYSILAWRIPWTEEPGGLQSMRLQRVWRDLTTLWMAEQRNSKMMQLIAVGSCSFLCCLNQCELTFLLLNAQCVLPDTEFGAKNRSDAVNRLSGLCAGALHLNP